MGGHSGGLGQTASFSGVAPQPSLTETTINNYYDTPAPDVQSTDHHSGGFDTSGVQDASYDSGDYDSGDDFGGTDV